MQFSVQKRDGPARVGELTIKEKTVVTPNILYVDTARCRAPSFADIHITDTTKAEKKPVIRIGTSLFSGKNKKKGCCLEKYLLYQKDVPLGLHREALRHQKQQGDCCLIPAQKDMIDDLAQQKNAMVFIIANARQLSSQQSAFVDYMVYLRKQVGYQRLIYLPSIGTPMTMALFAYMGVDLFDSFSAFLAARHGILLFPTGAYKKSELRELPCHCPSCSTIKKDSSTMSFEHILSHNYYRLTSEIKLIRNAITTGGLRELVETRVRADPQLSAMLRLLDLHHYQFLEERIPITRKTMLLATTKESLSRPEVRRFQERIVECCNKPKSTHVLLLLPCSAKKPYSFSPSHKLFRERLLSMENPLVVHEMIVTSPLGIVPRELELTYPASAYDIAVTGHWDEDEKKMIRTLLQHYLKNNHYDSVVMHLPESLQTFLHDIIPNPVCTCLDSPTSDRSLNELGEVLQKVTRMYDRVTVKNRALENMRLLASYQFGEKIADELLSNCIIQGKYPYQKIMDHSTQLGMITEERGMISLTLQGAERLAAAEHYWADIYSDFTLKGSVFAPGIKDADPSIRIGDDVIIRKNKGVCAVGVALMNGREMNESNYGEAVKVRHHH